MDSDETLARAREALAAGQWETARSTFEVILKEQAATSAEVLHGLGRALWWQGDGQGAVEYIERAYVKLRRDGNVGEAGMSALWLSVMHKKSLGSQAASSGWLARARRLLDDLDPGPLHGWLYWANAIESIDPRHSVELAHLALGHARAGNDPDLELCSLAELGNALVTVGQVDEGLALVDEAMAGIFGGEFERLDTVPGATCSMLMAWDSVGDLKRAQQWCRAADEFIRTYGCPTLHADCRLRYGRVLLISGHWAEADQELSTAVRLAQPDTDHHAEALVRLAELRLRQGRIEEADTLLGPIIDQRYAQLAVGALRYARGEHAAAAAVIRRYLDGHAPTILNAACALDRLVDVYLADRDFQTAAATVEELEVLAAGQNIDQVTAHGAFARGRLAAAVDDCQQAVGLVGQAIAMFSGCKLPYETARARLALARILARDHEEVAVAEAQEAFVTFERLGATPDADVAASLLRSLGAAARTGPKDVGVLTKREQEVLRLLAVGLSNPEIGDRLHISRKTVSHHVSRVLTKLGLRNRAEAAAYSTRLATDARNFRTRAGTGSGHP